MTDPHAERYVRLGNDGYYYRPEIVEGYDCEWTGERVEEVVEVGPEMGNALLPADVRASAWADERGLKYVGQDLTPHTSIDDQIISRLEAPAAT